MSNADDIFWRRFGAILLVLIVFGFVVAFIARGIAGESFREAMNSPSAVAERIAPDGEVRVGDPDKVVEAAPSPVAVAAAPAAGAGADEGQDEGQSVYQGACVACHQAGVAGAPKLGDQEAWAPRIEQGQDALVSSVVNGKGAMPPKGGNASLTDAQIKAAVAYMVASVSPESSAAGTVVDSAKEAVSDAGKAVEQAADKAADVVEKAADKASDMAGKAVDEAKQAAGAAMAAAAPAGGDGKPGDEVYNAGCVACHATGAANAPKLTDKAAWETRAAAGLDALIASVLNGKGAMPPKGGLVTLSDADVGNAVRYMLEEAGVDAGN